MLLIYLVGRNETIIYFPVGVRGRKSLWNLYESFRYKGTEHDSDNKVELCGDAFQAELSPQSSSSNEFVRCLGLPARTIEQRHS
jgi:hypothetical protein